MYNLEVYSSVSGLKSDIFLGRGLCFQFNINFDFGFMCVVNAFMVKVYSSSRSYSVRSRFCVERSFSVLSQAELFFQRGSFIVNKKHKESEKKLSLAKYFGVTTRTIRQWKKDYIEGCLKARYVPYFDEFIDRFYLFVGLRPFRRCRKDIEFCDRVQELYKYFNDKFHDAV